MRSGQSRFGKGISNNNHGYDKAHNQNSTQDDRQAASSIHEAYLMTTFAEDFHTESYNASNVANRSNVRQKKKTKRISQMISEAGYKLYGSFIGSHNQIPQGQSHQVPYT